MEKRMRTPRVRGDMAIISVEVTGQGASLEFKLCRVECTYGSNEDDVGSRMRSRREGAQCVVGVGLENLTVLNEELSQPMLAIGLNGKGPWDRSEIAAAVFEADADSVVAVVVLSGIPDNANRLWLVLQMEFVTLRADILHDEIRGRQEG